MEGAPARVEDAWDREDFDAVKFCKELFPDEASLKDVDKVIEVVKRRTRAVDEEIFAAVRVQGGAGPSSRSQQRQELGAISSGQVSELFARLRDIQRQAEESEAQVADICRDIRKLDAAKRHLGEAIAALKGMANLQSALGELEAVTAHRSVRCPPTRLGCCLPCLVSLLHPF